MRNLKICIRMNKKVFLLFATVGLLATACQDAAGEEDAPLSKHTQPKAVAPHATNGDEYLYTVTYTDLDYFGVGEYMKSRYGVLDMAPAGCSSARTGNFHGRNLDYYVNECADLVITMRGSKDRLASIGTSADFPPCTKQAIDEGTLSETDYAAAAYYMNDGINECGVVVNSNVVPAGECDHTSGTKPGATTIVSNGVVRYLLDRARSVDHAIELLKGVNIAMPTTADFHYESHWMISDPTKTVVVEVWNNELIVMENNVMTNFYISHPDTPMGIGHERYDILAKHIAEGLTAEGMETLMKRVWYSKAYSTKEDPIWYSEGLEEGCGFTWADIKSGERVDEMFPLKLEVEKDYQSVDYQKSLRDGQYWYTTHSIVYDIEQRTMSLICQENDTAWKFKLKK